MSTSLTTATLTTATSAPFTKAPQDTLAQVLLSAAGTSGSATFVVEGALDGTNYGPLGSIRNDTRAVVNGGVGTTLTDGTVLVLSVPAEGYPQLRVRFTSLSSGSVVVSWQSAAYLSLPFSAQATSASTATYTTSVTTPTLSPAAGGNLSITGLVQESATNAVTAHAGGTQAAAVALTTEVSGVTTVATAGDSVKLPASAAGLTVVVVNTGAQSCQVYGAGTDTINGVATATGVAQMANSICFYCCPVAGSWFCEGIGSGYAGSFPTVSYVNALTAHAGGGQGSATPLTSVINRVTTVGTAADSVLLPASVPGTQLIAVNAAASNSMNVFPASGDAINALSANAAFAVAAGKSASFYCANTGQWHSILTA